MVVVRGCSGTIALGQHLPGCPENKGPDQPLLCWSPLSLPRGQPCLLWTQAGKINISYVQGTKRQEWNQWNQHFPTKSCSWDVYPICVSPQRNKQSKKPPSSPSLCNIHESSFGRRAEPSGTALSRSPFMLEMLVQSQLC